MKLTKRKGFNFFRSYYDVYNELTTDKEKAQFIDALLDLQFLGIEPTDLKGMPRFAYISQTNSIDSQVKGYEDKLNVRLDGRPYIKDESTPMQGGKTTPTDGGKLTPCQQGKEEVQEEVQEDKNKKKGVPPSFDSFLNHAQKKAEEKNIFLDTEKVKTKFEAWLENGWCDLNGKKIINWKVKITSNLTYWQKVGANNKPITGDEHMQITF